VTEISFYFNVPSRTGYACRLLRRAQRQGMALAVTGPAEALDDRPRAVDVSPRRLPRPPPDRAAATFRRRCTRRRSGSAPIRSTRRATALCSTWAASAARLRDLRARLRGRLARRSDRHAARERWKAYARRGYPIKRHEVSA
jgi:DNA polymerase-3 subunit chi